MKLLSLLAIPFFLSVAATSSEDCAVDKDGATLTNGKIMEFSMLHYDSIAFLVFNDLGVAPFMANRELSSPKDVAQQFNLSVRAAAILMATMCRQGILDVAVDNDESLEAVQYVLTEHAKLFLAQPDGKESTINFVKTWHDNFFTAEALLKASRPTSDDEVDKMSQHLKETDEEQQNNARGFMKHMNAQSYSCAQAFPNVLGLGEEEVTMVDVGGGSGVYTIAAAQANPKLKGLIFDLASVKPVTEEFLEEADMMDRIKVVPGDFFSDQPFPTADIVLFANIIHDWDDATNLSLLQKAFDSLRPGGRVVVSELLLADDIRSSSPSSTSMNVVMLQWTKGRQYRPKELKAMMKQVGFATTDVKTLVDDYSLVIGYKK